MWNFKVCHTILQNFQGPRGESLFSLEFARVKSQIYTMSRCFFFQKTIILFKSTPFCFFSGIGPYCIYYIHISYNLMVQVFFAIYYSFFKLHTYSQIAFRFFFLKARLKIGLPSNFSFS